MVIDQRGAHVTNDNVAIDSTTSNGEDSGGVSGWSIKERFAWNNAGTWADKGGSAEALRITVNGYEGSPVVFTAAQLAPGSLTASLENGSVRLNWSAPEADAASVTGYAIFRANPQLTPAQPFAIYVSNTGNTNTAYLDEEPIAGTRNSYRVAAWRGTVASANSNNAFVDVPVPSVSSVVLTSNPGLDNTYSIGNTVRATVTFSAAVDITGSPQLELNFDGSSEGGRLRDRHGHDHDGLQLHGVGERLGPERRRDRGEQADRRHDHGDRQPRPPPTSTTARSRSTTITRSTASARRSSRPAQTRRRRRPTAPK